MTVFLLRKQCFFFVFGWDIYSLPVWVVNTLLRPTVAFYHLPPSYVQYFCLLNGLRHCFIPLICLIELILSCNTVTGPYQIRHFCCSLSFRPVFFFRFPLVESRLYHLAYTVKTIYYSNCKIVFAPLHSFISDLIVTSKGLLEVVRLLARRLGEFVPIASTGKLGNTRRAINGPRPPSSAFLKNIPCSTASSSFPLDQLY